MSRGVEVELLDVSKQFQTDAGVVRAVDGISLTVAAGADVAVTGPSGCGKSTLLSLIGALEPPSSGDVRLGPHPVSGLSERGRARVRRELIGFVFQSDNLQPFLTALENVSLQLSLAGLEDTEDRSMRLLAALGLKRAADRYPDQLSGGERQRVAVARALVHRPRLILADEPTGSLDVENSTAVIDLLRDAREEVGATLIVITHDAAVADRFGRRIALRDGRVAADLGGQSPPGDPHDGRFEAAGV